MRKLFIVSMLIMTFCAAMSAQTDKISLCPTIDLTGPPRITAPGEVMTFIASLSKESEKFNLQYKWTISNGELVEGQGTLVVRVLQKAELIGNTLGATLEVIGLPKECTNIVSALAPICECIESQKVDEFTLPVTRIDKARLENLRIELNNNPSANAYIIEHFEKKTSRSAMTRKNKKITDYLKSIGIGTDRFALLNALTGKNLTQFYTVPAGAMPPTCDDCITVQAK